MRPQVNGPEKKIIPVKAGVELSASIYRPTEIKGDPIILIHGLQATSEIFDVPGAEKMSLPRYLSSRGYPVVTFDQRGTRESKAGNWSFGLAEVALEDLPAVIVFTLQEYGVERVTLGGHSLGGTISYALRAYLSKPDATINGITQKNLGASFAIASPVRLSPEIKPWSEIREKRGQFIKYLDADRDGRATRGDFIRGQFSLYSPILGKFLSLGLIRLIMKLGSMAAPLAGLIRTMPFPVLVYNSDDFDNETYSALLKSSALDDGSVQLMSELIDAMARKGEIVVQYEDAEFELYASLKSSNPFPLLTICSSEDKLVPHVDAMAIHEVVGGGTNIVTEDEFGIGSGHGGYLFKDGLWERVAKSISDFL
jgi:pimeloyl-ACP methyl ester carboxylesterase